MFVGTVIVAVGIGIMVAAVLSDSPRFVAFHSDEGPTIHLAFPVLTEEDLHIIHNDVIGSGDAAVVIALLHGESFESHVAVNMDGLGINC